MGWFSNLRSSFGESTAQTGRDADPAVDADSVQQARVRSRRRLIGSVVLVMIGVIGFPLVFETQPRPIPVDIPIEIPRKESMPPLVMPAAKTPAQAQVAAQGSAPISAPIPAAVSSTAAPASMPTAAPNVPNVLGAAKPAKPAASQALEEVIAPGRPPAAVASLPVLPAGPAPSDGDRAKALLEGRPVAKVDSAKPAPDKSDASKEAGRFVVQVGAFAENDAARSTRLKVEKLGLKTYVQVAETPAGKRIRVRVGPYTSKEEAEQAKTKLTAGGFTAVLLVL